MNVPQRWQEQIEKDLAWARAHLVEQGELLPMITLHRPDQGAIVLGTPFPDQQAKELILGYVRALAIAEGADGVSFVGEAWSRAAKRGPDESAAEAYARARSIPPAEADDRIEIIMVQICYRAAGKLYSLRRWEEIVRDGAGQPCGTKIPQDHQDGLTEVVDHDPHEGQASGLLAHLLLRHVPTAGERRRATDALEWFAQMGLKVQRLDPVQ